MNRITGFLLVALLLLSIPVSAENNPQADAKAIVTVGNARFTVLTDRLIRMEWSENGKFEDHATLAIVNRQLPVPKFSVSAFGDGIRIKTSKLTLSYSGNGSFDCDNLSVSFKLGGKTVAWHPGMEPTANLMGTARTLDQCTGPDHINNKDPMETGILSRDGWAIVDESSRHVLIKDDSDWGEWVAERSEKNVQDLYIFAYGHDYLGALADFTKVAGKIPMVPKYAFGYWWSRFWAYSDDEFLALAREFRDRRIPIDVMVIDMDWHYTWQNSSRRQRRDEFGQSLGWTGYSWNRDLFADPEGFLNDVHAMNLKTSLNLHPASGISPREDSYPSFVADYLSRTDDYDGPRGYVYSEGDKKSDGSDAKAGYHAYVPFRMSQQEWADAYFNSIIHPLENQGVDFWWLDWQQWKESKYVNGLSNTFWLNYTFFNDKVRRTAKDAPADVTRPMIYHRWGGLGSHRYQLGFSGDTHIKWEVLGYLPYFTATASNVCYGYWGHDLGGHMQRGNAPTDPELFTRWLQYGVFSPLFKTHSTSSAALERRIWMFPEHYEYMKQAIELRYALSPYIYDASRQAYDTGVSLCRPMYYYYPEDDAAYTNSQQYMFGDNILAAPICAPADTVSGLSEKEIWFPAGNDWYDMAHRCMIKGGTVKMLSYSIDQNAWFVKAGSVIPMAEEGIQNLQQKSNAYRLFIAPGVGKSTYVHYEDDEVSQDYEEHYATTLITKVSTRGECTVEIAAREGEYHGMESTRMVTVVFGGLSKAPRSVKLDGREMQCSYDATARTASIALPEHDASTAVKLVVRY